MACSLRKARSISSKIVAERYPGYYLLMDRLSKEAYASLWGLGTRRLELVFARKGNEDIPVYASEYQLLNPMGQEQGKDCVYK